MPETACPSATDLISRAFEEFVFVEPADIVPVAAICPSHREDIKWCVGMVPVIAGVPGLLEVFEFFWGIGTEEVMGVGDIASQVFAHRAVGMIGGGVPAGHRSGVVPVPVAFIFNV